MHVIDFDCLQEIQDLLNNCSPSVLGISVSKEELPLVHICSTSPNVEEIDVIMDRINEVFNFSDTYATANLILTNRLSELRNSKGYMVERDLAFGQSNILYHE